MAFTKFYDIDTSQSLRRNAFLDDGVLCLNLNDLATPVTSNRARTDLHLAQPRANDPSEALDTDEIRINQR